MALAGSASVLSAAMWTTAIGLEALRPIRNMIPLSCCHTGTVICQGARWTWFGESCAAAMNQGAAFAAPWLNVNAELQCPMLGIDVHLIPVMASS